MKIFAIAYNDASLPPRDGEPVATPIVYTKADSALFKGGRPFFLPDDLGRVDYGVAIVARLCRLGKSIPERFANRYYDAVTCGVDFTAVDLLRRLRADGQPWELAKGFDGAAVIGDWVPVDSLDGGRIEVRLDANGLAAQHFSTGMMRHSIDSAVAYISRYFTIRTGDLLFAGTVGHTTPAAIDDHLDGYVGDTRVLSFNVK